MRVVLDEQPGVVTLPAEAEPKTTKNDCRPAGQPQLLSGKVCGEEESGGTAKGTQRRVMSSRVGEQSNRKELE